MERPSLYTIEEIFGNKANSTIRMYAIKIVSNFLLSHFPLHHQDLLPFASSELLRLHPLISLLTEKKLSIDLENVLVRFVLFRDAMMDTHQLLRYYKSQVEAQWSPDHSR